MKDIMSEEFSTYEDGIEWLYYGLSKTSERVFRGTDGFDKTARLLKQFNNPQDNYPTVHIAGTSGKGTTARLTSDLLVSNGRTVGTVMSPHVYDLRERFTVNCEFVAKSEVLDAINVLFTESSKLSDEDRPTYFEATLILAYLIFSKHKLDYLVVETGFGGLLDGTNLISRADKIAVITQIGLDHTEILGSTLEEIAKQKAGIITDGIEVLALKQSKTIDKIFTRAAKAHGASIDFVKPSDNTAENPSLQGSYQQGNIALAIEATRKLAIRDHWNFAEDTITKTLDDFKLPGRFEIRQIDDKTIILDGAHNQQKISSLVETLKLNYPKTKFSVVFASSKSRNYEELIELVRPLTSEMVFTVYSTHKSDMKRVARDFTDVIIAVQKSTVINSPEEVIEYIRRSKKDVWLVTGSFFVVSEVGSLLP